MYRTFEYKQDDCIKVVLKPLTGAAAMLKPSTISDNNPERSFTTADRMARLLGWFSIGLGLAELIAPGRIAKAVGLEGKEGLLRAYGGREIASGVGALSVDAGPAMWSRVAGDLIDLGTLASGARNAPDEDQRRYAGYAIAAVVGVTLLDLFVASTLTKQRSRSRGESRDYSEPQRLSRRRGPSPWRGQRLPDSARISSSTAARRRFAHDDASVSACCQPLRSGSRLVQLRPGE
jgi:hypothetical protein